MNETLVTLIQYTYTTVLPLVLGYIVKCVRELRLNKDAGKQADMLILRLILMDMHDRYVRQGYVSRQGFQSFDEIWTLYTEKYKGNHLTEKFKKEVENLPIRPDSWEEANNE